MQFTQKIRFGYTQTRFEFCEDQLDFFVKDETQNFGFRVNYENIYESISIQTYSEKWPLCVCGILWIISLPLLVNEQLIRFGYHAIHNAYELLTPLLIASAVIFGVLSKHRFSNDAKQLKTILGTIIVLNDKNQQTILDEIKNRRRAAIKKKFAYINPLNEPSHELARFKNLFANGIISEDEFSSAASKLTITGT